MSVLDSAPVLRLHRIIACRTDRRLAVRAHPKAILSFTFDDFPKSAVRQGAATLAEFGMRGTFYGSMGLMGQTTAVGRLFDESDLESLVDGGHEIACHTFEHVRCCDVNRTQLLDSCDRNRHLASTLLTPRVRLRSFSFPEGVVTATAKRALGTVYETCRTIERGINVDPVDLTFLRANPLYTGRVDEVRRLVDEALTTAGWVIVYGHDVEDRPSVYGCTPNDFREVVRSAALSGIEVLPVAEAASRFAMA